MKKQVIFKDLILLFDKLKKDGYSMEDIVNIPLWIGDDENIDIQPATFCKNFNINEDKDVIDYIKRNYVKKNIDDIILIR